MNHTIREQRTLRGIGQHKPYKPESLTVDHIMCFLCFCGFMVWVIAIWAMVE